MGLHLDSTTPGLDELLEKKYVCPMNLLGHTDHHGNFTLTSLGRSLIRPCIKLTRPMPLMQYQRSVQDFGDFTCCELVLTLSNRGWEDTESKPSKKLQPYFRNGKKVWFWQSSQRISKLYLLALVLADDRIEEGIIEKLHHCQPQAYYRCIIDKVSGVLPNQPLAFYKLLTQKGGVQKTQSEHRPASAGPDDLVCETSTFDFDFVLYLFCLCCFWFTDSDSSQYTEP